MKNKIIRFSVVTAACLMVYTLTTFGYFKSIKIADFLSGFSLGIGSVTAIALIYNIVIAIQRKDNTATIN
ncbi:hypothetical protein [Mucilaginibacter sp.]